MVFTLCPPVCQAQPCPFGAWKLWAAGCNLPLIVPLPAAGTERDADERWQIPVVTEKHLEERQPDLRAPDHLQFICPCQVGSLMTLMSCLSFTLRKSPFKDHQPISIDSNHAGHDINMCWIFPKY